MSIRPNAGNTNARSASSAIDFKDEFVTEQKSDTVVEIMHRLDQLQSKITGEEPKAVPEPKQPTVRKEVSRDHDLHARVSELEQVHKVGFTELGAKLSRVEAKFSEGKEVRCI